MKKLFLIMVTMFLLSGCVNNQDTDTDDLNAEIEAKNEEIAELNQTISELEGRVDYLRSQLGKKDKDIFDPRVQVGDRYYQYYTAGGRYLEDGIVLIL